MYYTNELYHHGILGQKWGVRRYQNADGTLTPAGREKYLGKQSKRINSMYDHSNKWANRKIEKLDKKGKTAKADVMRYMVKSNEKARKEKLKQLDKMETIKDLKKSKRQDRMDYVFGGQDNADANFTNMTSFFTRAHEYNIQRGMRWASNFTMNKTLSRMPVEKGYNYLRMKHQRSSSYNSGYSSANSR